MKRFVTILSKTRALSNNHCLHSNNRCAFILVCDVDQMAAAACFLLSPAAAWINGITLHVGGGGHLVGNPFYHPLPGARHDHFTVCNVHY